MSSRCLSVIAAAVLGISAGALADRVSGFTYVNGTGTVAGALANFYDGNFNTTWQSSFVASAGFLPDRLWDVTSFSYCDAPSPEMLTQVGIASALTNNTRYADTSTSGSPMSISYSGRVGMFHYYSPGEGIVGGVPPGGSEFYLNGTPTLDPVSHQPYLRMTDPAIMTASSTPNYSGYPFSAILDHNILYGGAEYAVASAGNGIVDFDFGSAKQIDYVEAWQRQEMQITAFRLIFSNNSDFSSPVATVNVGSVGMDKLVDVSAQGPGGGRISAQYMRFQSTAYGGNGYVGLTEMAFYNAIDIPEPAALSLLVLGSLAMLRRRGDRPALGRQAPTRASRVTDRLRGAVEKTCQD